MYKIGDVILYGTDGVCRINEITEKKFGRETSQYYVLQSVYRESSVIYVPVGNEKLESKMRTILSKTEIDSMIESMPGAESIWIENEPIRKVKYKEIITGGNRGELIRMIKALREHRTEQEKSGKKMHISDERFLKDAEKILYDEIAHVLHIKPEQVPPYILQKLEAVKS